MISVLLPIFEGNFCKDRSNIRYLLLKKCKQKKSRNIIEKSMGVDNLHQKR